MVKSLFEDEWNLVEIFVLYFYKLFFLLFIQYTFKLRPDFQLCLVNTFGGILNSKENKKGG